MGKKNKPKSGGFKRHGETYLQMKQREERAKKKAWVSASRETFEQFVIDMFCITLNDPEVMEKDVIGEKRFEKIEQKLSENYEHYQNAMATSEPESDVLQEELDARLKALFKTQAANGTFRPFLTRYSFLRENQY